MAVYAGNEGAIFLAIGPNSVLTEAATTANVARTRYQITDASKRILPRLGAVTVETSPDGVTWTPVTTGYHVQRIGGIVIFDVAQPSGTQVRITGEYVPVAELANAQGWSLEISRDILKYSKLRQPWKAGVAGVGDCKGTLSRMWFDGELFNAVSDNSEIVYILYTNYDAKLAYGVYGAISGLKIENSGDAIVAENVDFEGFDDPVYGITL